MMRQGRPTSTPLSGRSYWQRHGGAPPGAGAAVPAGPRPEVPARVDFAVIGGGLAGLSSALALADAEPGARIVVLEANFVGYGASGRNAGLLSPLPAPLWLASAISEPDHLWGLKHLNGRVHEIARWLETEAPESVVTPKTLRLEAQGYFTAMGLSRVARLIDKAGIEVRQAEGPRGQIAFDLDTHAVDPYRTVVALAEIARRRGITIVERRAARAVEETTAGVKIVLDAGLSLEARAAIVCTNAYSGSVALPEKANAKVVHNFMVATNPVTDAQIGRSGAADIFAIELNTSYVFYRIHEGRVVYGGIERFKQYGANDFNVPPDVLVGLERLIARSFPGGALRPEEAWGGIYHQTGTDLPIVRRSGSSGAVVLNVGYGGTGVAMTMICGRLAAALVPGGRFVNSDDERLLAALSSSRMPVRALARFVGGVASDVLTFRRPG
jgi:glycine/D-amino acid oxidase-like deaminating enzyme